MKRKYAVQWQQAAEVPSDIKGKLRATIRSIYLSISSAIQKKEDDNFLRCLFCHYVFDNQREDFKLLLKELLSNGEFVNTETCIDMLKGKRKIDKRYYHLSIDDGFRNNFTNALPILKKYNVPAIFFVPSSLIGSDWEKTAHYCLNSTRYNAVIEMLRKEDLKSIISDGYEIGSHSKTHLRFSAISNNKDILKDEIIGSKNELEDMLNYDCKYISWPYGEKTDVNTESLEIVKQAGYEACFGAYRGTVNPGSTSAFSIPRHHFEVQWPISHTKYFMRGNMEVKE